VDIAEFRGDLMDAGRVHAEALVCGQGFTGELEQNAFKGRSLHERFPVSGFRLQSRRRGFDAFGAMNRKPETGN
jgi:hypothetical protein